ncbi:iron ABC transporter ATP-binding protein [Orlajensenia leifsoniae]|uniref:iron ABC transporter ATP-binding protein n=1 Tax=Orlajensenia leifsoniae TaxID=2561933 RepID=UPI00142F4E15|nr:iron ABC transporter ATP-binding protein [Leifsonia flava]
MPSRLHSASIVALLPAVLAVGLLAGCTPDAGTPNPSTSAPSDSATGGASEEPTTDPSPTPTVPAGTPITIGCDELLTTEDVYAFNPNFGPAADYTPTADSAVAAAAADNGLACGWSNQSSGELIEVAVAKPDPAQLVTVKQNAAATMNAVPTYGTPPAVDGFFSQSQDTGTVQVFTESGYWVVARSTAFFEPGDAVGIITPALSHLP